MTAYTKRTINLLDAVHEAMLTREVVQFTLERADGKTEHVVGTLVGAYSRGGVIDPITLTFQHTTIRVERAEEWWMTGTPSTSHPSVTD